MRRDTISLRLSWSTRRPMSSAAPSTAWTIRTPANAARRSRGLTGIAAGIGPPCSLARIVAAIVGGHAAIDRAARNRAADSARRGPQQPVTEHAMADHRAGDAADDRARRSGRAAADLMRVMGAPVIMMAMVRRGD